MRWCFIRSEEGARKYLRALRGRWPILLLAAAGLLLLLVGGNASGAEKSDTEGDYMTATEEYRRRIESDVSADRKSVV